MLYQQWSIQFFDFFTQNIHLGHGFGTHFFEQSAHIQNVMTTLCLS